MNIKKILALSLILSLSISNLFSISLAEDDLSQGNNIGLQNTNNTNRYLLDTGDILQVFIPSLSIHENAYEKQTFKDELDVTVNQDGKINIPPFGEITARNKSVQLLQTELEKLFSKYLKKPRVFVTLKVQRSYMVYVFGEVRHPGAYQFLPTAPADNAQIYGVYAAQPEDESLFIPKISALIKRAGGLLPYSDTQKIEITNPKSNKNIIINLSALLKNKDTAQDLLLDPDDRVFIPESDTLNLDPDITTSTLNTDKYEVRVIGYALKQLGVNGVQLDSRSMTLLNALGKVNVDRDVNLRKVTILRKEHNSNKLNSIIVNSLKEDYPLQPDDTILLINRKFSAKLNSIIQAVGQSAWGAGMLINGF